MIKAVIFDLFKTLGEFKNILSDQQICTILKKRGYEIYPQTFKHAFAFVTFIDNPKIGFPNYEDMFSKTFDRIGIPVDEETLHIISMSSPLLEDVGIEGARGVLINITGGPTLTLHEVNEAATLIQEEADDDANIIFGAVIDDTMGEQVRITVIATGFGESAAMVHPLTRGVPPPADRRGDVTADGRRIVRRGTLVDPDAELETPTWMRRSQDGHAAERGAARPQAPGRDEPDFDVPAFLRRGPE